MRASLAGFVLTVDCDRCASPADQAGRPGQCPPLQDPDGEGGVDVSQCRGIAIGHTCEARCDANTGYTGHPTRYTCGGDGETWGWIADTTYPVCTSSHNPPAPPPPSPPPGGQPEQVDFVHPIVNVMGTGGMGTGMEGYSTFQLALAFSSSDVANVYAIYVSISDDTMSHMNIGDPGTICHLNHWPRLPCACVCACVRVCVCAWGGLSV